MCIYIYNYNTKTTFKMNLLVKEISSIDHVLIEEN